MHPAHCLSLALMLLAPLLAMDNPIRKVDPSRRAELREALHGVAVPHRGMSPRHLAPPKGGITADSSRDAGPRQTGSSTQYVLKGETGLPTNTPTLVLVVGAAGTPDYATNFQHQAALWTAAADKARARLIPIGTDPAPNGTDLERLRQTLTSETTNGVAPLWIVMIGHGTFDGKEARHNLRGPDLTATDLADWLKPCPRPLIVVNTTSASAPFLARLSATNRVVLTATRSGHEHNFARLGDFLAEAILAPESDLDQDGQTSLLEAFLTASHRVAEWYNTEGRLATEHALIDDNGDGRGTPFEWFRGVRAIKQAHSGAAVDGARAHQIHLVPSPRESSLTPESRARRDALELELFRLRDAKSKLNEDDYYRQLEVLLLELARLQAATP